MALTITTTSSSEYMTEMEMAKSNANPTVNAIYPAFVDNLPYQAWTIAGSENFFQLKASGTTASATYSWRIESGRLPEGLSLIQDGDGKISGIPTKEETCEFTVRVTSGTESITKKLAITAHDYRSKWYADSKFGANVGIAPWADPDVAEPRAVYNTKATIDDWETLVSNFSATHWAEELASLGCKSVIAPSKFIDGIRLWPSLTPSVYELKTTRNYMQQMLNACHDNDIKFLVYFAADDRVGEVSTEYFPGDQAYHYKLGVLNKGLIDELVKMTYSGTRADLQGSKIDGFWMDVGATPEIYAISPLWFDWEKIIPMIRTKNPYAIFASNPGIYRDLAGTVLKYPDTDVITWEAATGNQELWLEIAVPSIIKKKVALEVWNTLDTQWSWVQGYWDGWKREPKIWVPAKTPSGSHKSSEMIIKSIKKNWDVGAVFILNWPTRHDGVDAIPKPTAEEEGTAYDYKKTLNEIGVFVKKNQGYSVEPRILYDAATRTVTITSKDRVFFTTDGSEPLEESSVYIHSLTLNSTTQIKAKAKNPALPLSKVVERVCTVLDNTGVPGLPQTLFTSSPDQETLILGKYDLYRGMQFTVGQAPLLLHKIGRRLEGTAAKSRLFFIKTYYDDAPVLVGEFKTTDLLENGYQYATIPALYLAAGKSYVIAIQESSTENYYSNNFLTIPTSPDIRITGPWVANKNGDHKGKAFEYLIAIESNPYISDHYKAALYALDENNTGALLNLKYVRLNYLESKNQASGRKVLMQSVGEEPLPYADQFKWFSEGAVDNNPDTVASPADVWVWQLLVDLQQQQRISKVRVTFKDSNFATEFVISYRTTPSSGWLDIAHVFNSKRRDHYFNFVPINAQHFRVKAIKPDDAPGGVFQEGVKMAIVNFECY